MRRKLEAYFEFAALGATWRTEILAGFTTFMTMAYIVFVNPSILHEAGMPLAGVTAATCLSAAVGSFLMGGLARYPVALAPGMGLNAYFTYAEVKGLGAYALIKLLCGFREVNWFVYVLAGLFVLRFIYLSTG